MNASSNFATVTFFIVFKMCRHCVNAVLSLKIPHLVCIQNFFYKCPKFCEKTSTIFFQKQFSSELCSSGIFCINLSFSPPFHTLLICLLQLCRRASLLQDLFIHIRYCSICLHLHPTILRNYYTSYTTLQGWDHKEEKTMTSPWPST